MKVQKTNLNKTSKFTLELPLCGSLCKRWRYIMTANQVAYWNLQETKRNNIASLEESRRHNVAGETETNRHNTTTEGQTEVQNEAQRKRWRVQNATDAVRAISDVVNTATKVSQAGIQIAQVASMFA